MSIERWTVDRRILLACLGAVAFLLVVNIVSGTLVDRNRGKMDANEIASPWDRTAAPPAMGPSTVTAKAQLPPETPPKPSKRVARPQTHGGDRTAYAGQ